MPSDACLSNSSARIAVDAVRDSSMAHLATATSFAEVEVVMATMLEAMTTAQNGFLATLFAASPNENYVMVECGAGPLCEKRSLVSPSTRLPHKSHVWRRSVEILYRWRAARHRPPMLSRPHVSLPLPWAPTISVWACT